MGSTDKFNHLFLFLEELKLFYFRRHGPINTKLNFKLCLMSHLNPIALIVCLGFACHLCKMQDLQTNVYICVMLPCQMHLACYRINRLAILIHHVHRSRNRNDYVMLACVLNTGVEQCPHLMIILKNVLYSKQSIASGKLQERTSTKEVMFRVM